MFKKIIVLFVALALLVDPLNIVASADNDFSTNITYSSDNIGCIGGTIEFNCPTVDDGSIIKMMWGDSESKPLIFNSGNFNMPYSEFATAAVQNGKVSVSLNSYTAIPVGAKTILFYHSDDLIYTHPIAENKQYNGELLYNFGALSDVHFGRYYSGKYPTKDDAETTFDNALDLFENLDKVDVVAISGDLTVAGEELSLQKYNATISGRGFPVYSCTGNHDMSALEKGIWKQYVNNDVYRNYKDMPEILTVKGNDFVYRAPNGNDHDIFIFLSQHTGHYGSYHSELLSVEQLEWLEKQLEKHKNETVYLFFHTFLTDIEGGNLGCGNAVSSTGVSYTLPFTYRCEDEIVFRNLLIKYKNVMFFSGHSHFEYSLQNLNVNLNVYDREGTTGPQIHLSSVTAPRNFNNDGNTIELQGKESQGSLVSVYEDKIIVYGIDFNNKTVLSYATYIFDKTIPPKNTDKPNDAVKTDSQNTDINNAKNGNDTFMDGKILYYIIPSVIVIVSAGVIIIITLKRKSNKAS